MGFLAQWFLKLIFLLCCSHVLVKAVMEGQKMNKWSLQTIEKNETRCSKGTVLERRSTTENNTGTNYRSEFIKRQPYSHRKPVDPQDVEHAIAFLAGLATVGGAKAQMNTWNPTVEVVEEFSVAQISVAFSQAPQFDVIEAGWHVHPSLYGDTNTRFYIYWRAGDRGCYNHFCEGFIHNPGEMILGSSLAISSIDGPQHNLLICIRKNVLSHWTVKVNDRVIGEWPRETFGHLGTQGTHVEWGGWVHNTKHNNRHTSTLMGSGRLANEGPGKTGYFHDIKVEDGDARSVSFRLHNIQSRMTNANCYNITTVDHNNSITSYYGGPGFGPNCP